jgi:16S rRNA (guanine527-N7)-methyltransferase
MQGEGSAGLTLNRLLAEAGLARLSDAQTNQFEIYLSLFVRWNSRTNLSAIRQPEAILSRHFVESIACARAIPSGLSTLLDFGSGGGLPGIPIAICRPEIAATLSESQGKKAAFLQEAVRTLGISARVFSGRAETLAERFDCVTLRAVDKMSQAVESGAQLVKAGGLLALMTTRSDGLALQQSAGAAYEWQEAVGLPGSDDRILILGRNAG